MTNPGLPALIALAVQIGLGFAVFQANPKRRSNQCFLFLALAIACWLVTVYLGLTTRSRLVAEFCIREASAVGVLILYTFNLLRLSIREQEWSWGQILRRSKTWLVCSGAVVVLCQTHYFLREVRMPSA